MTESMEMTLTGVMMTEFMTMMHTGVMVMTESMTMWHTGVTGVRKIHDNNDNDALRYDVDRFNENNSQCITQCITHQALV